jgi:hypothetical protein
MSRLVLAPLLIVAGVLCGASTVRAQTQEPAVHWHVMGGYSDTSGSTANYLQGGYIFGGGLSLSPAWMRPLEMRFDLSYSEHNATITLLNNGQQALNQPVDSGTGSIFSGSASLLYYIPIVYGVRAYGIAGVGAYHTRIELDQALPYYGGYGYGYVYGYGYGYGYGYPEAQVAAHGVTNFGWNAGVGVEFALPFGHSWFIETRYQHINSTQVVQYLPIEIGFRF